VTTAIRLLGKFRKQHAGEPWANIWQRIYPEAIPNYAGMKPVDQKHRAKCSGNVCGVA
jgi:hypothetical protein